MNPNSHTNLTAQNSDPSNPLSNFENRQKYVRCSVYLQAQLISGDQSFDCMVLDISYGGARVQVSEQFAPETDLALRIEGFDDLQCKTVRQQEDRIGLGFTAPTPQTTSTVNEILGHEISNENRKYPRRRVLFKAKYHSGIRVYPCKITDISLSGMRVKSDRAFSSEDLVTVESTRFGTFSCKLAWQDDTLIGLKFLDSPSEIVERIGHILPQS